MKKRSQVISEMAHYYIKQSACPTGQQAGEHKAHNWTSLLKSGLLLNQSEGLLLPSIVLILMAPKFHLATCNLMAHYRYSKINSNEEEEQCSKKLTLFNYQHSCNYYFGNIKYYFDLKRKKNVNPSPCFLSTILNSFPLYPKETDLLS